MIRPLLHDEDIYAGLQPEPQAVVPGWNDHSEMFGQLLGPETKLVIEVGTWLGRSAIALARAAPNAEIVCIDTWSGAMEMWLDKRDPERYGALRIHHGYPTIFHNFRQNVVNAGLQDRITPFPVTSTIGLRWLKHNGIRPDAIFIDASHDYDDVVQDIAHAARLNPPLIMGDDYQPGWPGVVRAVDEFFPQRQTNDSHFWWVKL